MNRLATLLMLVAALAVPASFAQGQPEYDHGTIGVFMNYTRLHNFADTNFYGVGGRIGINVHPNVQLEAEGAYDFEQNRDSDFTQNGINYGRSSLRMVHGLFGPKIQIGTRAFRLFGTVKGGALNFSTTRSFPGQISQFGSGDTNGVFYPGGGIEGYAGPFGIRIEVGDEMYIDNGVNHNLRLTFGPLFRF
ncbi:MAG TPA: hypothetical protein VMT82_08170 [candidate division Zixibacteria bacterium]|nr:hypothetical protein [candidate division Zixibacteria bacterium]